MTASGARIVLAARRGLRCVFVVPCVVTAVTVQAADPPVSFARQVAPLLAAKCGGCHVAAGKGGFRMASYEELMKSGMVQRGAGNASRLVEVILTGDMPRGGGKVTPAEVGLLTRWIDAGAACDADPAVRLDRVAAAGPAAARPGDGPAARPAAPQPLRAGDVAFSTEVAPVLLDTCARCHGETKDEGGLRMHTLQAILDGKAVTPGKGAESLLVRKLRGKDIQGQRMPLGRPPLPDDVIARIEKWIDQGARIDLLDAGATLEAVVAAGRTARLSEADLATARREAASAAWRRAIPDEEAAVEIRERISVVGNLPRPRLGELADLATGVEARVRDELVGRDGRLLKGGVIVFAFRNSYDYSAFWQEVIGGERPKGLAGHAGSKGEAVYGAILVPASDPDGANTSLLLAEQICGAAFAGRGAPDWFARGAGRSLAVRLYPKAAIVQEWKRDLPAAVREVGSCTDFFGGRADRGAAALAAGGFVGALAPTSARLKGLVAALDGGTAFDAAFTAAFRGPPEKFYDPWAAKEARRKSPGR